MLETWNPDKVRSLVQHQTHNPHDKVALLPYNHGRLTNSNDLSPTMELEHAVLYTRLQLHELSQQRIFACNLYAFHTFPPLAMFRVPRGIQGVDTFALSLMFCSYKKLRFLVLVFGH